ncbi:MAG TPA: heavy metal-associated domain-containing protein, partial [Dehalococcoidia bacterium]
METTLTFDVKGMTCDNCVNHVTKAVRELPGVRNVKVDLATNSARVEGDVDERAIIE